MAWGMERGKDRHEVWLRFSARVAPEIREAVWHRSQRIAELPDRRADLHLVIDGLDEILGWVLGFGDQVEVLAPPSCGNASGRSRHGWRGSTPPERRPSPRARRGNVARIDRSIAGLPDGRERSEPSARSNSGGGWLTRPRLRLEWGPSQTRKRAHSSVG